MLTQLRFIHHTVIMGLQSMVHWWVPVHGGPHYGVKCTWDTEVKYKLLHPISTWAGRRGGQANCVRQITLLLLEKACMTYGTFFGGKINWFGPKNSAKRRVPDLENQESGYGPRYSPTQGFNLLQISPNWFLGNWTLAPRLKCVLEYVCTCWNFLSKFYNFRILFSS
jgi:hypothetical protein